MTARKKEDFLRDAVEHIDITQFPDVVALVEAMGKTAFQARNLARAAGIYDRMLADKDCTIILCLAGSLISAGLKKAIQTLVRDNMVDAIVSTGANIVDQDFFEGLGFKHYLGSPFVNDAELRELHIDRIYDTFIDEDELRVCDETVGKIADSLILAPIPRGKSLPRWAGISRLAAWARVLSCWRPGARKFLFSALRSPTAAPGSA